MTQMELLIETLKTVGIPFEITENLFTHTPQLWYPCKADPVCDVICHQYSYGGSEGLLEIMGLLTDEEAEYDSVKGWLDAVNVGTRIITHWFLSQ